MSDFLTRLAQRQLGQIATIEPRLPGLHAYVTGDAAFLDIGLSADHPPDRDADQESVTVLAKANMPVPTRDAEVSPDPSTLHPLVADKLSRHEQPRTAERPPQIAAQSGEQETPRTDNNRIIPAEVPRLVPAQLSLEHRAAELPAEAHAKLPASEVSPIEEQQFVAQKTTASPVESILSVQRLLVARKESDRIAAPSPLYGVKEPALIPRRATPLQAQTMDAAEPAVRVTIGRIEVSAVTASAPPKRASIPRKPTMSLDDYLARRQRRDR